MSLVIHGQATRMVSLQRMESQKWVVWGISRCARNDTSERDVAQGEGTTREKVEGTKEIRAGAKRKRSGIRGIVNESDDGCEIGRRRLTKHALWNPFIEQTDDRFRIAFMSEQDEFIDGRLQH